MLFASILLFGIVAAAPQAPAPAPATVASLSGELVAPDSTVKMGLGVRLGALVAGDSAVFRHFKNDTVVKVNRRPAAATMRDSTFAPAPAYGQSARYKSCVQIERGGRDGLKMPTNQCTASLTFTYTRPAPLPPATIDSLWRITIRTFPLVPGGPFKRRPGQTEAMATDSNRMRACAFATAPDGGRYLTTNSDTIPICRAAFTAWLAEKLI